MIFVLRLWVEQRGARLEPAAAKRRPTTQAAGGPHGRDRTFSAREPAAAHGARHFKKLPQTPARQCTVETAKRRCYLSTWR